ncbi:hypothetical protein BP00DRAFT_478882 [Aspergillus indologenus CBS 114.80]|uniref:Uncharacterized protein n=1 Tax=Aspergillus indologenus CBS 114.80 TaxID=1450541 RepID=A0A2V5I0D9_9EURO|nr:hypothetical protein BP00DRAFT_478882 [Aspergillus indologenus CBS 114.80]
MRSSPSTKLRSRPLDRGISRALRQSALSVSSITCSSCQAQYFLPATSRGPLILGFLLGSAGPNRGCAITDSLTVGAGNTFMWIGYGLPASCLFTEHRISLYTYLQLEGVADPSSAISSASSSANILLVAEEPLLSPVFSDVSSSRTYLNVREQSAGFCPCGSNCST